ncbi:MAG TPA: hypothetical protein VGG09_04840 [Acidimicrobiales bacterium]|jgi:hypothetical protein
MTGQASDAVASAQESRASDDVASDGTPVNHGTQRWNVSAVT